MGQSRGQFQWWSGYGKVRTFGMQLKFEQLIDCNSTQDLMLIISIISIYRLEISNLPQRAHAFNPQCVRRGFVGFTPSHLTLFHIKHSTV